MFVEVFSEIPQRVLWRADDFAIKDIPSNVRIAKWFPQRDVLGRNSIFLNVNTFRMYLFKYCLTGQNMKISSPSSLTEVYLAC